MDESALIEIAAEECTDKTPVTPGNELARISGPSPLARRAPPDGSSLLLGAADQFLASPDLETSTVRAYEGVFRGFVAFLVAHGGRGTLDELHFDTVTAYLKQKIERVDPKTGEARREDQKPSTLAKKVSALRGLVKHLEKAGFTVDPLLKDISVKAGEPPTPRALSPDQVESLLAAPDANTVRGKRDAAVLHILTVAGLRRSEVAALDVDDYIWRPGVEPDHRSQKAKRRARRAGEPRVSGADRRAVARSRSAMSDRVLLVRESKGKSTRMVPIDAKTEDVIDTYLASRLGREAIAEAASSPVGGPLIVGLRRRGGKHSRLTPGQIGNIVKDYADAVELHDGQKDLSAHDLRHTFCTAVALSPHGGIERVQALAGHKDMRTSARYVTVDDEEKARTVAAVWSEGRYGRRG